MSLTPPLYTAARAAGNQQLLRPVRLWLDLVALMVIVMVLVGGATRLTDSGLSITEWAPISGAVPPLNHQDWLVEFSKYQTTTEFQTINSAMTLEEFKAIYWWEWGHRFLGRLIGLVYALPLAWFWLRGRLPAWLKPRLLLLLVLGGLQGGIGWWMVKSGLVGRVDVSQIRLAIHLTLACAILAYTIWLSRSVHLHQGPAIYGFRWQATTLLVLLFIQIFLGGLLAGLDGGMAYNTWPDMNGSLLPEGLLAIQPVWQNLFENSATIQFLHRMVAYLLAVGVLLHALKVMREIPGSTHSRRALLLCGIVAVQVLLGIIVLLNQVPIQWAILHQLGALVLLIMLVAHMRALEPRRIGAIEHKRPGLIAGIRSSSA